MKWVVLAVVLVIMFALFRRMNRDTTIAFWQSRPEMPFDDFYSQFYSSSGMDREAIRMVLHTISRATGVPENRIVPTDRIDDLKPGALSSTLSLMHRILETGFAQSAGIPQPASWKADTVDDVIHLLAPYHNYTRVAPE